MTQFSKEAYWRRIGFSPIEGESMRDQLVRLHRCHAFTIPFEDIDSFCHLPISLDSDDLFEKVVLGKRGGYCFELNQLFFELLGEMGYDARMLLCRPYASTGEKRTFTHRMTAVSLDDDVYICDVGFGGNGWTEPLLLAVDKDQPQRNTVYRIIEEQPGVYTATWRRGEKSGRVVEFTLAASVQEDFEMANYFTSTHPDSVFRNRLMCILPTAEGRVVINAHDFKIERGGEKVITPLTPDNIASVLAEHFGIEISATQLPLLQRRLLDS